MTRTADVVVVGAGVIGASTAFHLAERGAGRVLVVDRARAGEGMSGRSSALVRLHYSFPAEVRLALLSRQMFERWNDVVGAPGDFRATGFVRIVPEHEADLLRRNVEMQRDLGADAQVITAAELKELEPDWNVEDVAAAAWEPGSGYGDGAGVASDFMAAARGRGIEYLPDTPVRALRVDRGGSRVTGITTDGGDVEAGVTLVAANVWSPVLLRTAGVELPIEAEYHQTVMLKNPDGMKPGGASCIDSITACYFRSERPDMTLVGGFYGPRGMDPDALPATTDDETVGELVAAAARRIPALEYSGIVRGITGLYDTSPDFRPLLGAAPGVDGLLVAIGFSGMGFKIAPAVGRCLAELILDGRATAVDLHAFRPSRFAEGEPIKAEFEYEDD
jgi:glycine/D-amino acid oxidase-like deaminating enzyme